ncbi:MAG: hypothetical protein CVV52_16450, partial [Spirochaetae bacterium HGW-Spirochaetae-8]
YFIEGHGEFNNQGSSCSISPGVITFSFPEDTHSWRSSDGKNLLLYWVQFSLEEVDEEIRGALKRLYTNRTSMDIGTGHGLEFEEIRRRAQSDDPLLKRSASYRFAAFLCDLLNGLPNEHKPITGPYIGEALLLMQRSLGNSLCLDDFAHHLGIDKAYFVRLFKQATGLPPMRYYLSLRIDSARWRLRDTGDSIRSIALDLGFRDEFHFSNQFKRLTGLSPSAWREL